MRHYANKTKPNFPIQYNSNDAQSRAPQRERILASRWLLVDGPEAREDVDLVGERDGDRYRVGGDKIVRAFRLVMILDGVGDGLVLALGLGVISPHKPLHFRKFADHLGCEI